MSQNGEAMSKLVSISAVFLPVLLLAGTPAVAADVTADALAFLQTSRTKEGSPELERLPELDAIAFVRASELAGLPVESRGPSREPILPILQQAGVQRIQSAVDFVDTRRPTTTGNAFARLWRTRAEAWQQALDRRYDAIGLATASTADDHTVFVAILLERRKTDEQLEWMIRRIVADVNGVRQEAGIQILTLDPRLTEIAQEHAEEMAREGWLAVVSPSGVRPYHRLREKDIGYARVGAIVARNSDPEDPAKYAFYTWKASASAHQRIYDHYYSLTGVGIAVDAEGQYYFSQIFLRPRQ
jgi:hypothetical protein